MRAPFLPLFILLSGLLFLSCQEPEDNPKMITAKSPVTSIVDVTRTGGIVTAWVWASWPNGCGRYSHYEIFSADSVRVITVYGQQPEGAVCTQGIIRYLTGISIPSLPSGSYTFRFWQSDTTTVDTTFTL